MVAARKGLEMVQISYCGQGVRTGDPDRFLLSLFAPPDAREALWALFAFHLEIAKTRDVVTDTRLGLIRLQWWRDAVDRIYASGGPVAGGTDHPVLTPLCLAIGQYGLSQADFTAMLYAREFDLEDVLPAQTAGFLTYIDATQTPLLRLAFRICGGDPDEGPDGAVVPALARLYGIAGMLRAVPFMARRGRCLLPAEVLQACGQDLDALYAGKPAPRLPEAIAQVAGLAPKRPQCDNRFLRAVGKMADIGLAQIRRVGYDVFHPRLRGPVPFQALRVWWDV